MQASKQAHIVIRADKTGFPGGSVLKSWPANAGDSGSPTGDARLLSESGRSPGGGNGNLLQCSCLGNPMGREAWWAPIHAVTKNQTRLSKGARTHTRYILCSTDIYRASPVFQAPSLAQGLFR